MTKEELKQKFNRVASDQRALQNFVKEIIDSMATEEDVSQAIVADKNILSKITKEYDEGSDVTYIRFPVGVMPLRITINNHTLYFKNYQAVNNRGQSVEGYELDEAVFDDSNSYICFVGDLSEQVINDLIYVNYNGGVSASLALNSYYLFFPEKIGTKLYKHIISGGNYTLKFISHISEPLDFTEINSYFKLNKFIQENAIGQLTELMNELDQPTSLFILDSNDGVYRQVQISNGAFVLNDAGDFSLEDSVDTVTEL